MARGTSRTSTRAAAKQGDGMANMTPLGGRRRIRPTGAKPEFLKLHTARASMTVGLAAGARMIQRHFGLNVGKMSGRQFMARLEALRGEAQQLGGVTGAAVHVLSHHLEALLFICERPPATRLYAYHLVIDADGIRVGRERAHRPRGVDTGRPVYGSHGDVCSIPIVGTVS